MERKQNDMKRKSKDIRRITDAIITALFVISGLTCFFACIAMTCADSFAARATMGVSATVAMLLMLFNCAKKEW